MSHKTIDQLQAASSLVGSDLLIVQQSGQTKKVSLGDLAQAIAGLATVPVGAPFRGALVYNTDAVEYPSMPIYPSFNAIAYDTDNFFSGTNPTRLTVPAGVTKVRLWARCALGDSATSTGLLFDIRRNGLAPFSQAEGVGLPVVGHRVYSSGWSNNIAQLSSAVISVAEGDYFELHMNAGSTTAAFRNVAALETTFAIEVVEADA